MITYTVKFGVGEFVYVKHDAEQRAWMVTAVTIRGKTHLYELTYGLVVTSAAEFELTTEEDVLKKVISYGDSEL